MSGKGRKLLQKQQDAETLQRKLQDLQHSRWVYEQNHGEIWPGLFDGPLALPAAHLVKDCQLVTDRLDIISALPKGAKFAEIGTLHGDFIVQVIAINQPAEVHIYDIDFKNLRPENLDKIRFYGKAVFHEGDSSTQLSKIDADEASLFDVIYVDADHTYDGVWKDLTASLRLLKYDGYLVCNDYTTWDPISCCPYGVFSAVNRFATENNLAFTHLALESCGYHDVALRRVP